MRGCGPAGRLPSSAALAPSAAREAMNMQPHLEVDFGHLPYDSAAEAAAREGMALLHRDCSGVGACHVTIAGPADGHHLWQPPHVQIAVQNSGAALSVD